MATLDIASSDVAAWDSRGHVVAENAAVGGGAGSCQRGRGHVTAMRDPASCGRGRADGLGGCRCR